MIVKYAIENFKAFANSGELRLGRINVLLGRNSAGKSSLFQPLQLISQTIDVNEAAVRLVTHEPHDFGGFFEFAHHGRVERDVRIAMTVSPVSFEVASLASSRKRTVECDVGIQWKIGLHGRRNETHQCGVKQIGLQVVPATGSGAKVLRGGKWNIDLDYKGEPCGCSFNGEPLRADVALWSCLPRDIRSPQHRAATPFVSNDPIFQHPKYFYSIHLPLRNAFGLVRIRPMRPPVPRIIRACDIDPRSDARSSSTILASLFRLQQTEPRVWAEFKSYLDEWLGRTLGFVDQVDIEVIDTKRELFALIGLDKETGARVNLADTGFGVAQILPILVQLYFAREGQLVIIEEPEAHLNPAAQRLLFDLIARHASRGCQIVVETHSEHFLLRMRRRSVENPHWLEEIRVYFIDRDTETRQSRVTELPLTVDGRLDHWPKGFLAETFEESNELFNELAKRED